MSNDPQRHTYEGFEVPSQRAIYNDAHPPLLNQMAALLLIFTVGSVTTAIAISLILTLYSLHSM